MTKAKRNKALQTLVDPNELRDKSLHGLIGWNRKRTAEKEG
jgi:hypothetical protein